MTTPAAIEEMRSVAGSSGFKVKWGVDHGSSDRLLLCIVPESRCLWPILYFLLSVSPASSPPPPPSCRGRSCTGRSLPAWPRAARSPMRTWKPPPTAKSPTSAARTFTPGVVSVFARMCLMTGASMVGYGTVLYKVTFVLISFFFFFFLFDSFPCGVLVPVAPRAPRRR